MVFMCVRVSGIKIGNLQWAHVVSTPARQRLPTLTCSLTCPLANVLIRAGYGIVNKLSRIFILTQTIYSCNIKHKNPCRSPLLWGSCVGRNAKFLWQTHCSIVQIICLDSIFRLKSYIWCACGRIKTFRKGASAS